MTTTAGWRIKSLSEVVSIQRGFDLPHHARRPGSFPVLTSGETGGFHDEGPIKGPGITIGRATNLGQPKWSDGDFWPHNTTMFVKDFKGNHPRWVFHFFEITDLAGYDSGSVQPMLNRNYIAHVPVLVPPIGDQRAIAEVLGALDDKIAANANRAATAEALGKAIFQDAIAGPQVSAVQLRDVAENVAGKYLAKEDYVNDGPYYIYGSNSIMGRHDKALQQGRFAVLAKIGSYCGNLRWSQRPAWVNNNASAIVPAREMVPSILRHALELIDMTPHKAGTGQPYIRMESLFSAEMTVPDSTVAVVIAPILESLLEVEAHAGEENVALAATRHALLPQLMSGTLRVKDAQAELALVGV